MKTSKSFYPKILLLLWLFLSVSCSAKETTSGTVLVGSTPGDGLIKSLLNIPEATKVDFIKWNLVLNSLGNNQTTFQLDIHFGKSQPNTLVFKLGGEKRSFEGTYTVTKNKDVQTGSEIYQLKSKNFSNTLSIIKISDNLFHLLTPQNKLIPENGGWSYSLNRKDPANSGKILISSEQSENKSLQLIFEGRTPCQEIAREHPEMNAGKSCFKLKWKLSIQKDSISLLPSTYVMRKVVDNQPRDVSGKWTVIYGIPTNPEAIIYKIEADKPGESISFFVADDNILFFLDKNNEPYTGNENFSYTLNRRLKK